MTTYWPEIKEMPDEEFKKMMAEGKELRYQEFVSKLHSAAKEVCPTVTEEQLKVAFQLRCVLHDLFNWKEASEFFERFVGEERNKE